MHITYGPLIREDQRMKPLQIRDLTIGEGAPKTIVSLMGATAEEVIAIGNEALAAGADCLEWRVDFAENVREFDQVAEDAKTIRAALPDAVLLFTFRTVESGGKLTLPVKEYVALNKAVIETETMDLIDLDSEMGDKAVKRLAKLAHKHGMNVIVSYHSFEGTPKKKWLVKLMRHMQDLGADIPKVAVMAKSPSDTLKLLAATEQMHRKYAQGPLLTMAMGQDGAISRLSGESFGSAMTFCALKDASAPGQVDLAQAKQVMDGIHSIYA